MLIQVILRYDHVNERVDITVCDATGRCQTKTFPDEQARALIENLLSEDYQIGTITAEGSTFTINHRDEGINELIRAMT